MNIKYFKDVTTLEELKKQYRQLAKKYHPDISKIENATEIMKAINKEYETLFEQLKVNDKHGKNESVNTFKDIINEFIKYDNITIDIVGSWLWIYGQGTFNIKDILKKYGFRWSKGKKKWYFFNNIQKTRKKRVTKNIKYDDIIKKYGVSRMTTKENKRLLLDN